MMSYHFVVSYLLMGGPCEDDSPRSSETPVTLYQLTRPNIQKELKLHQSRCENRTVNTCVYFVI